MATVAPPITPPPHAWIIPHGSTTPTNVTAFPGPRAVP